MDSTKQFKLCIISYIFLKSGRIHSGFIAKLKTNIFWITLSCWKYKIWDIDYLKGETANLWIYLIFKGTVNEILNSILESQQHFEANSLVTIRVSTEI